MICNPDALDVNSNLDLPRVQCKLDRARGTKHDERMNFLQVPLGLKLTIMKGKYLVLYTKLASPRSWR